MKYRPEIDGLRALAVVPVVLFHAGAPGFSGGFAGVDIFFVISGYLITTILVRDLDAGRFSILRFYDRRARRILPALFFVMLCCLPFAWAWTVPEAFRDFGQSVVAATLFLSNALFWWESGYFDRAGELKPLLHTWSLAIEEQYYILFPPLLWAIWWVGGRYRALSLIFITLGVASLILAEILSRSSLANFSFFMLPTRAWELLAGALCALLLLQRAPLTGRGGQACAVLGLGALIASIGLLDETTIHPGLWTVLPVGGTMLVILAGRDTLSGRMLALPPLVGIGLVSYSFYLWHQPVFAFARVRSLEEIGPWGYAALIGLAFGLACFSWAVIERPFRQGSWISPRTKTFRPNGPIRLLRWSQVR